MTPKNNAVEATGISPDFLTNIFATQIITIKSNTCTSKDASYLSTLGTCPVQTQGFIQQHK
jgi:hypothetical protein